MIDPEYELTLIGFSHRTAPVAIREQFSVKESDLASLHQSVNAIPDVAETFVLSTCNRT